MTAIARNFGILFPEVLILNKKWLGYILADFFINSSGHPDSGRVSENFGSLFLVSKIPVTLHRR
jgi:hypothetical protein